MNPIIIQTLKGQGFSIKFVHDKEPQKKEYGRRMIRAGLSTLGLRGLRVQGPKSCS